jgi:hypothetical protein
MDDDRALCFALPAIPAEHEQVARVQPIRKGHGRRELRTLEGRTGMEEERGWPGAAHVIRRTGERRISKRGMRSIEGSYGLTDLTPAQAGATQLEALWRRQWTIENRDHHVRDVTLGEDQGQAQIGSTAHALAAWRNGVLMLLRRAGWRNIADALRAYAASVHAARTLIGALPAGL